MERDTCVRVCTFMISCEYDKVRQNTGSFQKNFTSNNYQLRVYGIAQHLTSFVAFKSNWTTNNSQDKDN